MNLLCIDTTSSALVLCLVTTDRPLAGRVRATGGQHAEVLLPEIGALLEEAQLERSGVDAVGVTLGPGGFTSVRVGLATAKGLCLGGGRSLYAASSLRALAFGALPGAASGPVAVVTRAYRGEVYAALYAADGSSLREVLGPLHATPEAAAQRLSRAAAEAGLGTVAVLGDGVAQAAEVFADAAQFELLPASLASLTAEALGAALLDEVRAGRSRDVTTLEPEYLRPPDAALPQAR